MLTFAGTSHLTVAREEFTTQAPEIVPLSEETNVATSGMVEIGSGAALMLLAKRRVPIGWAAALFCVAIFPGNIAQWVHARDDFGLDTDTKRFVRLCFQSGLVLNAAMRGGVSHCVAGRSARQQDHDQPLGEVDRGTAGCDSLWTPREDFPFIATFVPPRR